MKLLTAGCSFSDYCKVEFPYGKILANKLNAEYLHEGAGGGSNWRTWRRVTKCILDKIITSDDLLLVQYTERVRTEFCSALTRPNNRFLPGPYYEFRVTERFEKDYSIIRYKPGAEIWQDTPEEKIFFNQYEKYFVIPEFAEEQFRVHHFMFQQMLKNCKIKTIFINSQRNPPMTNNEFLPEFQPYIFREPIEHINQYSLSAEDYGHMSQQGHEVFADWLYTHINNTNILSNT